ncbi:SDR family NAD(P)-dependent oxidoreductase [Mycolicibacter sinensis]|uniref:Uncharacterized protein n=1 Tax=Mycolicibacter sinensis (strain JDM601) TaxID=875328 RepID=A0A1A3TU80_MYCSD|nr:SDR family NAD(P)-dependent oxidoreductase [Mycolicibacter sinensis]OBK86200.1 hypothetical protein A5648_06215 [Mycolicibacter sinensis]
MTGTQTALVTEASRDISATIASRLAPETYALSESARSEPGALKVAASLRSQHGFEVHRVVANLADQHALDRLGTEHAHRFARLDVLAPCAGAGTSDTIADMPLKHSNRTHGAARPRIADRSGMIDQTDHTCFNITARRLDDEAPPIKGQSIIPTVTVGRPGLLTVNIPIQSAIPIHEVYS